MTSIDDPHPLRVLAHSNSSLPALSGEESQKMPTTDSQDAFADPTTPRHQSDPLPKLPYRSSWLNLTVIDQIPDFLFPLLPLLHSRHISPFLFLPLATLSISLPIYSHLLAPTAHDCLAISLILLALLTLVTSLLRIPFKRAFKAWWCISILIIALWISFETPPLVIGFVVSSPTVKIFPRIPVNCFAPRLAVVRFETDANVGGLTKAMNASEMKVAVGRWRSKIVPRRVHPDGHVYELDSREIADKEGFRFGLRCWGAPVLSLSPWVVFDRNTYDLKLLQTPPDLPIRPNVFHSLLQCVTNPGTNVPPLLYSFLQHRRVLIHIAFVWPLFTFFISKVYLLLRPIRSTPTPTQPPPSIQPPLKHTEKRPRSFSASNQNPRRTSVAFIEPPTSRRVSTPNRKALNIRRPSSSTHLRHSTPTRPTSTDDDETSYILLPNDQIPTPWQRTLPLHRRPKPRTRSTSLSSSTSTTIPASAVNQWRQELASKQTTSPPPPAPLTPPPTLRTVPHFRIAMPPPVPVAQMYTALAATPPSETSKWMNMRVRL
ncbi:hypothetical protein BC829DRAFT_291507 [Chytridium lagenaria]|nr:hypothetical protein BC829DRAFT_291507 [Chytridium lagenaria]